MDFNLISRLESVKVEIRQIEEKYSRTPGCVKLLAVSKTKPIEDILQAYEGGQTRFGESYVQEAVGKITALRDKEIEWHFIGPIQKNKTKQIAENFSWVHSIDREIIAQRLNEQRPQSLPALQACIQVNIDDEKTKSGVALHEVESLAHSFNQYSNLKLCGLMAIPQISDDIQQQRQKFTKLKQVLVQLNQLGFNLDTLSMGMSGDLEAAIAEGATIVRVGTAIFGEREAK